MGSLFPGWDGAASRVGVVDYLIEAPLADGGSGFRAGQYARALARFTDRAREVFSESYYAESGDRAPAWTLDDLANETDAPHVPVGLPYDSRLALFGDLSEVAETVLLPATSPYAELAERIRRSAERLRGVA